MGLQSWTQLSDQHFHFTFTECFTCVNSFDTWQLHELEIIIPILQVKKPRHKDMKELAHFSMPSRGGLSIQIQTTGFSKLVLWVIALPIVTFQGSSQDSTPTWVNESEVILIFSFSQTIIAHWDASWNREVCFSAIVIGSKVEMSSKHVRHVPADGFFSTYCR